MRPNAIPVFLFSLTLLAFGAIPASVNAQEAPRIITQANAPGWITVSWEHTGQDVFYFLIQRQNSPYTDASIVTLAQSQNRTDSLIDKNLQAETVYKYRVCAVYAYSRTCSDWVSVKTLSPPSPPSPDKSSDRPLRAPHLTVKTPSFYYIELHWGFDDDQYWILKNVQLYRDGQVVYDARKLRDSGTGSFNPDYNDQTPLADTVYTYKVCFTSRLNDEIKCSNEVTAKRIPYLVDNDFNEDQRGDILWHNASTGEAQIWFMNDSSRVGRATIMDGASPTRIGPPWGIVGSGDFNNDRKTDVVWHNATTGETQVWHLNGYKFVGRATVLGENGSPAFVGLPWSIVGTNDFGTGSTALLWHNDTTGETQIWHVSNHKVTGRPTVLGQDGSPAFIRLPWRIVGSRDFNRDWKTDLLWYNNSTGETQIWYMNGHKFTGRATVIGENGAPAFVGPPWRIVGTNDFNRDGWADILWYNDSTGETQVWFMNGHRVARRATVDADRDGGGAKVGPPWSIMNH